MPSAETEHYVKEAGRVVNKTNSRGKLVEPARRYLRHNEKVRRQEELRRIKEMLTPVNIQLSKLGPQSIEQARKHVNALEEDLDENVAPSDLSGETKDALQRELNAELEKFKEGMVPHEEMRRNPVGAVDRHIKHERANKLRALKIKNLLIMLNPDSDEQDLCNLERYRPHIALPQGASSFMPGAQIPGVFGMTAEAKANWPENMPEFGTANSALKQVEEREQLEARIAELEAKLAAQKEARAAKKQRRAEVAEAARARMKARWAEKKALTKQGE